MEVQCTNCDWTGDSDDGKDLEPTTNDHGVEMYETVCPNCESELTDV
jgi:hypothetical protein